MLEKLLASFTYQLDALSEAVDIISLYIDPCIATVRKTFTSVSYFSDVERKPRLCLSLLKTTDGPVVRTAVRLVSPTPEEIRLLIKKEQKHYDLHNHPCDLNVIEYFCPVLPPEVHHVLNTSFKVLRLPFRTLKICVSVVLGAVAGEGQVKSKQTYQYGGDSTFAFRASTPSTIPHQLHQTETIQATTSEYANPNESRPTPSVPSPGQPGHYSGKAMLGPDGKSVTSADGRIVAVDAEGRPITDSSSTKDANGKGAVVNGKKRFQKKMKRVFLVPEEVRPQLRKEE
ncbi:hypothetical protein JOM56_007186 [Amanita muscaria]